MKPLAIKKYPDNVLRKQCQSIEKITEKEIKLFRDMLFTMKHFCGIGLAAPQIGISKRLIVAEVENITVKLANPKIIDVKGSDNMPEGCLSVPDITVNVRRPIGITVKGLNEEGRAVEIRTKGLLARVLQHEIDHLNGKLIIDYMNVLERLKSKFIK